MTSGKIFLAERRQVLETEQFRRCSTGLGAAESQEPLGALRALHEETLAGGHAVALAAPAAAHVLVLPITGAVRVGEAGGELVEVGELRVLTLPAGGTLHLANPYPAEVISLLHIWLEAPAAARAAAQTWVFDPAALTNQLAALEPEPAAAAGPRPPLRVSLGRFAGRAEAEYFLRAGAGCCFGFVLAGAFEVAGRLLHAHDGLALWNTPRLDLEALSPDAVLLLLELD